MQAVRSAGRLAANSSYFFCCDMQEKFRPTIKYYPEIITVASKLVSGWISGWSQRTPLRRPIDVRSWTNMRSQNWHKHFYNICAHVRACVHAHV